MTHIAKIFRRVDKRMTGRRFFGGPFGFPGFCRGVKSPCFISSGYFPVVAISFNISAMYVCVHRAYFKFSDFILSQPAILLFF